jgi:methionyl-tRNA formyltransferase
LVDAVLTAVCQSHEDLLQPQHLNEMVYRCSSIFVAPAGGKLEILGAGALGAAIQQIVELSFLRYDSESTSTAPRVALGSINLHPSLLPKYRGASPIQSAIAAGETTSGISVLRVSERMDAGELFAQRTLAIGPDDDSESFGARCATEGGALLLEVLRALRDGTARPWPQDEALATETRKLEKEDGLVDWRLAADLIANRVRAYQPWPGAFTGTGLKILRVRIERGAGAPGTVLAAEGDGPLIACGEGSLRLLSLQPPGKGPMDGRSFLNGRGLKAGDLL